MTEEIKEMNLSEMLFNRDERLLNYITNLQNENNQHISDIQVLMNKKENLERLTKKLQKENEKYKKIFEAKERFSKIMPDDTDFIILSKADYDRQQEDIELTAIKLKSRNEKAIEYIEERKNLNWYADGVFVYELLNILQGGDE